MVGNPFSNLFGQSPIKPIQEHILIAHKCAEHLQVFMNAAMADDWERADTVFDQIADLENQADDAKTNIRSNLPNSLMMPVDRSDLLAMVSQQDQIANCSKDIAGIMLGRKMSIPSQISDSMNTFLGLAIETSAQAAKAVNEMDELLEMGFKGRVLEVVTELVQELNRLEHENDEMQIKVRSELFKIEAELPPVNVMFLYKVIERIGGLADAAQSAGGKLQLLIAH